MPADINLWPLIGVLIIIAGFALRFNPMLVVIVTAIERHLPRAFRRQGAGRHWHGLRQDAQPAVDHPAAAGRDRSAGAPWPAPACAELDQLHQVGHRRSSAHRLSGSAPAHGRHRPDQSGRSSANGAPAAGAMAEGATESRYGKLSAKVREKLRAMSAATDNVGLFFGEDIFVAFGAIVLMTTFLKEAGIDVEPIHGAMGHSHGFLCLRHPCFPSVSSGQGAGARDR